MNNDVETWKVDWPAASERSEISKKEASVIIRTLIFDQKVPINAYDDETSL